MRVAGHEPYAWFLLEESGRYYLDVRAERSAVEYDLLVQLTPEEQREYLALGRTYAAYLAARVSHSDEEYGPRNLNRELGEAVRRAIAAWRPGAA